MPNIGVPPVVQSYFANVRLRDWGGYIGMSLLGYLLGFGSQGTNTNYLDFLAYLMTIALYLGFSFSINNCFDHAGDRLGGKASRNPVALNLISVRSGVVFSFILAAAGLALTRVWFGAGPMIIYSAMLLLSGAYSTPPLRLKSVPVVDMLSHGLFFGSLIVFFGASVSGSTNPLNLFILTNIFVISLIVELWNQIGDAVTDAESGVNTTVVTLGVPTANGLLYALLLTHISMLVYLISQLGSLAATGVSMIFFIALSYQLLRSLDKDHFLFLIEKITPLVYLIYILHLIL